MILYHGSKEIVESPEIRIQRYNKDFYFGFYCTIIPEQAIRWATRFNGVGYRKCRKAPAFRHGDMRHVHRICASN